MTTKQQARSNAITYASSGEVVTPEVQTIVNVCRPIEAQGYAPVPTQGDRLPIYILGALIAAVLVMFGINAMDGDKRQLQAENAKLEAQQSAIAGCIRGVTGQ
jgi:hypothetical protein